MAQAEAIVVEFAAVPEYVAVARRVAEVVGARGGLTPQRLEELQIAVSEVCNRLVNAGESAGEERPALQLRFWLEPDCVVAEVGTRSESLRRALEELRGEEFALFLMRRLVDRVLPGDAAQGPALRLVKLRRDCRDSSP